MLYSLTTLTTDPLVKQAVQDKTCGLHLQEQSLAKEEEELWALDLSWENSF